MYSVLGADRLLAETTLKGRPQRRIAVRLEERVQSLDVVNPQLRASMRELREIRQGRGTEIEQVLALQIASRPLP
jgi:hypothetical protein